MYLLDNQNKHVFVVNLIKIGECNYDSLYELKLHLLFTFDSCKIYSCMENSTGINPLLFPHCA